MMGFECSEPNIYKAWDCDEASVKGFTGSGLSSSSSALEDELLSSESTKTTDEDDDYIAELTRQMTHYMLQDDHGKTNIIPQKNQELLSSVGWPQNSTLWSPLGSSHGSPCPSLEPTPPATPGKEQAWNSSYADVLRKLDNRHLNKEGSRTKVAENPGVGFCSKQGNPAFDQSHDYQKIEAYYRLKQKQISKKQGSSENRGRQAKISHRQFEPNVDRYQHQKNVSANGGRSRSPTQFGLPASNPWLNQQPRPGMRAVSLGGSGSKTGTGVFLPCVIGNTSQSPKKRGSSPVLIPARVVQALKVHFDRVGDLPRTNHATSFSVQNDLDALKGGKACKIQVKNVTHGLCQT